MQPSYHWQSKAEGAYATADFDIDWDRHQATCPEGRRSVSWTPAAEPGGTEIIYIKFSTTDCKACPARPRCTRSDRRSLTVRRREAFEAPRAARDREMTEEYRSEYARRAGIEGTISQGLRAFGLRRCRYIGEAKARLQHVATAAAIDLARIGAWLIERPTEGTRTTRFARLMTASRSA
jgi:transposase